MTTFKDLCIDVVDLPRMIGFWSAVLGLRSDPDGPAGKLVGERPEHTVWLNVVSEPPTVKQRVHIDVHAASIEELIELGASVQDEFAHWTVMTDPEGGEFCAFVREPAKLTPYRFYELVVDSADHVKISQWWADVFGGVEVEHNEDEDGEFSWIETAPGLPWELIFGPVPEPKSIKNRIHWDVWGDTDELIAAGARLIRRRDAEIDWDVLADPEGNEFCVFTAPH